MVFGLTLVETVSVVANVATVVALFIAIRQLQLGRRASSAASVVTINEAFRQAWGRFMDMKADDPRRFGAFCDVTNLVESACALHEDQVFTSRSGKLLERYLIAILRVIQGDPAARQWVAGMLHDDHTFEHMRRFVEKHRAEVMKEL